MQHKFFSLKYWFYDFVKVTSAIPGLIWFRPKWIYENREARKRLRSGALVAANHASHYDPVTVQFAVWYRRHRFVCLKEFFAKPSLSWLFSHFLCIPVDRENVGMQTFREIAGYLKDGWIVSVFPEGRIEEGGLSSFKTGIVLMAIMGQCPIVPVYIKKKEHWYDRLTMCIGEPVDIRKIYDHRPNLSEMEDISKLLREREEKLSQLCKR